MPASFKIILFSSANSDGRHTVYLRVTFARKSKLFSLNRHCKSEEWDAVTCRFNKRFPNHRVENDALRMYEQRASDHLHSIEREHKMFSFDRFEQEVLSGKASGVSMRVAAYMERIADEQRDSGKSGNARVYRDQAHIISLFSKSATLADIDPAWLKRYENWMRKRGSKDSSISVSLRTLRAACNAAIRAKDMPRDWYPFLDYSLSHLEKRKTNRAVSVEDLRRIEAIEVRSEQEGFARDMFMFSFYTRGMNFVDMCSLKKSDIVSGRITYTRQKTGTQFSIGINKKAAEIIERYQGITGEYVFPILNEAVHITDDQKHHRKSRVAKIINSCIRELAKRAGLDIPDFSLYSARHAYATGLKNAGVSIAVISEALGHSNVKTTEVYLKSFEGSVLDEADGLLLG